MRDGEGARPIHGSRPELGGVWANGPEGGCGPCDTMNIRRRVFVSSVIETCLTDEQVMFVARLPISK